MNDPLSFFEIYKQAANTKNKQQMSGLYHQDAELFDMWNAHQLHGIDNIRNMVNGWFDSLSDEQLQVEFSSIHVKQDGTVAFGYAFVHFRALGAAGKILRQMKNRITVCLTKTGESWLVLHQHTSIPISSKTLQGIFE